MLNCKFPCHSNVPKSCCRHPMLTRFLCLNKMLLSIEPASFFQIVHKYYAEMWSKGDEDVAMAILDDDVKLNDELWGSHPFVGRKALFAQVKAFRKLYPDLKMEIDDIGIYGTQDLAIRWSARATNLGGPHPTHHYTHFSGVSSFHFTADRKRVAEVVTYRQPTSEEMTNKCEISWRRQPSTTEIQL
eukprot:scaffold81393_cov48-Prasinocladus_malaysianus.AAC.1